MSKRKSNTRITRNTKKGKSDDDVIESLKNELFRLKEEVSELQLEKARDAIRDEDMDGVSESWLEQAHQNGNEEATYELASHALENSEYEKAEQLFEELEDNDGISDVYYHMGLDLYKDEKYKEAMKEFEKSAKLENSYSEYFIGNMFENALGVRKNIEKAIDYYKSSAEKKNFNSAVQLGVLYNEGKEVEKDIDKATEWFVKAADCGLL